MARTKTSTEVKRRYNDKTYSHINVAIPKDLAERFKTKCQDRGVSQAAVLKDAMEAFLETWRPSATTWDHFEAIIRLRSVRPLGEGNGDAPAIVADTMTDYVTDLVKTQFAADGIAIAADGTLCFARTQPDTGEIRLTRYPEGEEICSRADQEERIAALVKRLIDTPVPRSFIALYTDF